MINLLNKEKDPGKLRAAVAYLSTMLQRAQLAWRAGLQFQGKRDLYEVLGYRKTVYYIDCLARYQRQDLAKRIVTAPTLATWRNSEDDRIELDGGNAEFNTAWNDLLEWIPIFSIIEKADRMLGLGQFAILLLGLDDGGSLDQPVRPGRSGTKLLYMQPYSEGSVAVIAFDDNPKSPRYGKPVAYEIVIVSPSLTATGSIQPQTLPTRSISVHWSRVVHLAEDTLDSPIYGLPRLLAVYNLLDDLAKVVGGSAEAFWLIANRGMQIDIDKEMELDQSDAENLQTELEEYQHQMRRFIRTRGVKITELGSSTPAPLQTFQMLMDLISATTGIPQRILMGSEAGALASAQDRANWSERITERRDNFALPVVVRPLVDQLVVAGVLPDYTKLTVDWPEAFIQNPLEKGQTSAQTARSVVNLARQCVDGFPIITLEEARKILNLPEKPLVGTIPEPGVKSQVVPAGSVVLPVPSGEDVLKQTGDIAKQAAKAKAQQPAPPKGGGPGEPVVPPKKPNGAGVPA